MKLTALSSALLLVSLVSAVPVPQNGNGNGRGRGGRGRNRRPAVGAGAGAGVGAGAAAGAGAGAAVGGATGAVQRGPATLVFEEIGGVPGNPCLTFRNNGEIVDAACVNTAADRQITPSTLNGANVLLVERTFSNGFRPDLVGVQACVGNNGTHFLALPCAGLRDPVSFDGTNIRSASGACQSGHDNIAQITVDPNGQNCASFRTTTVSGNAAPAQPPQSTAAPVPAPSSSSSAEAPVATNNGTAANGQVQRGQQTLVFDEVNGVPGNSCLTFRNNGEIVDAACVNAAADRQITPSKLGGADVLLVQRGFSNGFRPDLVGVQACVGNNGTHFLALPCNGLRDPVSFDGTNIRSASGACQSGHDAIAQVTVDLNGQNCATFRTTVVAPTAP